MVRPTNELVAVSWLKTVSDTSVATELPQDSTTWASAGFTQVTSVGGTPDNDIPIAAPVLSLDFWAAPAVTGSGKPQWNMANARAEVVRAAVLDHRAVPTVLTDFPAVYSDARVLGAQLLSEPRRIRGDEADYAHYQCDLRLWWVVVP
jgi:hypothetical protein